jgi:hypothetical protein
LVEDKRWVEETIRLVCKNKDALRALPPPRSIGKSKRRSRSNGDDTVIIIESSDYSTELGRPHPVVNPDDEAGPHTVIDPNLWR